jgi:hypothetical protein
MFLESITCVSSVSVVGSSPTTGTNCLVSSHRPASFSVSISILTGLLRVGMSCEDGESAINLFGEEHPRKFMRHGQRRQ